MNTKHYDMIELNKMIHMRMRFSTIGVELS